MTHVRDESDTAPAAGSGDPTSTRVAQLIGVYHADGGPVGELKYVLGRLLGTTHCALCDITHSPVRRKPDWDAMVARLGIPFALLHLNEMPAEVAAVVAEVGSPVILARLGDGRLQPLLQPAQLEALGGSVHRTEQALATAAAERGWDLRGGAAGRATAGSTVGRPG